MPTATASSAPLASHSSSSSSLSMWRRFRAEALLPRWAFPSPHGSTWPELSLPRRFAAQRPRARHGQAPTAPPAPEVRAPSPRRTRPDLLAVPHAHGDTPARKLGSAPHRTTRRLELPRRATPRARGRPAARRAWPATPIPDTATPTPLPSMSIVRRLCLLTVLQF